MTGIPEDIMAIANEIVDRIAKVHSWKGDCVADVAQAILAERNSHAAERDRLREELACTIEELINLNGDDMIDSRATRVAELRGKP
jgi:hypothetical protein